MTKELVNRIAKLRNDCIYFQESSSRNGSLRNAGTKHANNSNNEDFVCWWCQK